MFETERSLPPAALSFEAFTRLVEEHQHPLHVFLRGFAENSEQALDLMQDTFYAAWRAARSGIAPFVEGYEEEAVRRWLFHTAYCRVISVLRRRRLIRWESLSQFSEPEASDENSPFEEQIAESDLLRAALLRLSPQDVACLLLRVVQGFSAAEVGQIVGASAEVVTKRLSRARQRLRAAYLALEGQSKEHPHP
jgi:RNA polymerase sigma-70 factor (ECF subfamily)